MVEHIRKSYELGELTEEVAGDDPFALLRRWLQDAIDAQIIEPNSMCLATVDEQGNPDARFVLLRGFDERGLVFYTNSNSAKGKQLAHRSYATVAFWWGALERQVRVRGRVERVDDAEADAYFATRPRGHQLAAWASPQSEPIPSRAWLEQRAAAAEREFEGREVPRPPYWHGYRIVPDTFEFWQGRPNRLHDRIRYTRQPDGSWRRERLAP
ncbi:MAG: pyridoxamine 5'-phosphate oxidase [Fimbriimonadales bacterium]|nr:pyridoxamine 5'-phosphate oxidase [Fimbriimonadales bacterium]MDW8052040.1 pyridoxamine 5'-phosphate oxidase [Armatimonadota bacterium]